MSAQLSTQLPASKSMPTQRTARRVRPIRTGVSCVLCGVAANAAFMITADAATDQPPVDAYTSENHYSLCQIFNIC